MTFWPLTNSDFPTDQTFHQFHDLYTELDLHRIMSGLQRVWLASRERLPFRTPGSVPHFGTCWCSNCWDQIPRTCHVFTRLLTSNTPWYFLDFAFNGCGLCDYKSALIYREKKGRDLTQPYDKTPLYRQCIGEMTQRRYKYLRLHNYYGPT